MPPSESAFDKSKSQVAFAYKTDTLTKKKEGGGVGGGGGVVGGNGGGGSAISAAGPVGGCSDRQSKKFGLKLFRLSFKKDKTKHLATFSAQFPPEEWPLREEDTPSSASIPREVEMEIIRRINPDLTVENVARHTAVMKRLEEERAQRSKAGSSAQHSARSRRSRGHRRAPHGKSRSHSKTRASRGDPSESSHLDLVAAVNAERDYRFFSHSLVRSPREGMYTVERSRGGGAYLVHSNPNIAESHFPVTPEWDVSGELAKRRTEMPFPEPSRGTSNSRVHRSHSHTQDRKSRNQTRPDKAKERSRSMDNSKGPLGGGPSSLGTVEDYDRSTDDRSRYYTDDGTLRASSQQGPHYSRIMFSAAKFSSEVCVMPDMAKGGLDESRLCSPLERNKSRDSLPAYSELKALSPKPLADDYFQCNTSNETILTAPSPLSKADHDTLKSSDGLRKGSPADRQTPHLTSPHSLEYKEDTSSKGHVGSGKPTPSQTPEPLPNGRLIPHQHNTDPGGAGVGGGGGGSGGGSGGSGSGSLGSTLLDKRKEIFSKDTLFKPPHSVLSVGYSDGSGSGCYSKSGTLRKAPHAMSAEVLESPPQSLQSLPPNSAPLPASMPVLPGADQSAVPSASEAGFDYYNVSDDEDEDETEDTSRKEATPIEGKGRVGDNSGTVGGGTGSGIVGSGGVGSSGGGVCGPGVGGGGTMQWLLDREKERDLQRKFENNLSLLSPKETDHSSSQKSAHSARLDSMDSSSVTVDSGFNSPRTRESLASNTSSIVESNRRQNPALSPGHMGSTSIGPPFGFRSIPEPPTTQPEKLQKSPNCLASITSV